MVCEITVMLVCWKHWQVVSGTESCVWTWPEAFLIAWWSRTSMALHWRSKLLVLFI